MFTIPPEYHLFEQLPNVDYLYAPTSCEIVFFYRVLKRVLKDPVAKDYHFYVLNEEQLPQRNKNVIVIQVGQEGHIVPEYINDVAMAFVAFPPFENVPSNLKAIPLGYNGDLPDLEIKPFEDREIDTFFSGQNSNHRWKIGHVVDRLKKEISFEKKRFEIHYSDGFRKGITPEIYANYLMNSKIAFAPRGSHSPVTFRLFEAARAGNVIISCELPDTWYYRHFPGIQLKDWAGLEDVLKKLLNDPVLMEDLHRQTLDYYRSYCSEKAVADFMIKEIKSLAG